MVSASIVPLKMLGVFRNSNVDVNAYGRLFVVTFATGETDSQGVSMASTDAGRIPLLVSITGIGATGSSLVLSVSSLMTILGLSRSLLERM